MRAVRGYAECVIIKHVDGHLAAAAAVHGFSSFVLGDGCQALRQMRHCLDSCLPAQGPMLDIALLANIWSEDANQSEESVDLSRWYDTGGWHCMPTPRREFGLHAALPAAVSDFSVRRGCCDESTARHATALRRKLCQTLAKPNLNAVSYSRLPLHINTIQREHQLLEHSNRAKIVLSVPDNTDGLYPTSTGISALQPQASFPSPDSREEALMRTRMRCKWI